MTKGRFICPTMALRGFKKMHNKKSWETDAKIGEKNKKRAMGQKYENLIVF